MINIVDIALNLIEENGEVEILEIIKNIENEELKSLPEHELIALIYQDLSMDGRFINVDNKWRLKNDYTIKEIVKEQYRSYEKLRINQDDNTVEEEEEIEMTLDIDSEKLEDDVIAIDDIEDITGE